MYQHPGVYLEEIPSGSRPIESASTSTALIAGFAAKGPVNVPTFILSFDQYVNKFGGINDFHGRAATLGTEVDHMGHAVKAFFDNGGSKAYIARLVNSGTVNTPTALVSASSKLIVPAASPTSGIALSAANPGAWANGLLVAAAAAGAGRFNVAVGYPDKNGTPLPLETYNDVTLDPLDTLNYLGVHVNGRSALLTVAPGALTALATADKTPFMTGSLTSGDLSAVTDFSTLNTKGVKITVLSPSSDREFVFAGLTLASRLSDVAAAIQAAVRLNLASASDPRTAFTCVARNGKLVMTSGINGATSAVTAASHSVPANDCIAALKLDAAGGAVAVNGQQAYDAAFAVNSTAALSGGQDGSLPGLTEYGDSALHTELRKIRDISVIFLPGQAWRDSAIAAKANIDAFRSHAETMKNRMLIIDPDVGLAFDSANSFTNEGFPTSTYTCTYYPWVEVANPHYHADLRPDRAKTVMIAPSGFAAGLWARTDSRRGVWKAPAGLQASVIGIARTIVRIGDDEQDQLNPVGVNCLRRIISDTVIWGSRTLATKADPEWRYVPVRRTAMMIEESIYQGIQWAVFEPNDHRLWGSLRLNIGTFMNGLFRAGAFQGEKASDAYFVRCGLNDTMTQGDIDAGQVIVIVGFAPVKPAEFVIVRLQQIVGRQ